MPTMPAFIYGTAWKASATATLVKQAITQGFKAIDTANQPKHYLEEAIGEALKELSQQGIERSQLFLQTKFTPANGHDEHIPYDPNAALKDQVETSFKSSLEHLKTHYLDSYLLHGPYGWPGLNEDDWQVWQAIERIYESGQVKSIGISNVNIEQLELLVSKAKIKPMVVQNRCFSRQGWDKAVRDFCRSHNIIYQGFSLLTANPEIFGHPAVQEISTRLDKTPAQILFRFAIHLGIVPLTGTSSKQHMQQDLEVLRFELAADDVDKIKKLP